MYGKIPIQKRLSAKNMVVWIVNPFDNLPMEGYRPQRYWLMARAFVDCGYKVIYWTSDFSHSAKKKRELKNFGADWDIKTRMLPTVPYKKNISLKRVYSHWKLAKEWSRQAAKEKETPDTIIASTPPLSLCTAAMEFAKSRGIFFVADIMDAWPETFERILPRWCLSPLRAKARAIYRNADMVTAVAKRYIELAKEYGAKCEPYLAYHGITVYGSVPSRGEKKIGEKIRLAYIGSMGKSYDLETLIEAVGSLEGFELEIAGSGPKEAALRKMAAKHGNIVFHGYLDSVGVGNLLGRCDIGVVPMFPDSWVGVPYKLADYAVHGLRVLESLGGETRELVERHGAGVHYEAGNIESLRGALQEFARRDFGDWDKEGFVKEFDSSRIMPEYVEYVKAAILEKAARR